MANQISPQAVVSPNAKLGDNIRIMPFVYIEDDVEIGDGCFLYPGVNLMRGTRLGKNNTIHQNTVISARPQDFSYKGENTLCIIGDNNIIRENVVINRATYKDGQTRIGNGNFLMEGVHISHDDHIGNENVFGYGTKIAGDVEIGDYTIFSSGVIANPGVRVGDAAMVSAGCRFSKDIPPYIVAKGYPIEYGGLNTYVLGQLGISDKVVSHIANAYRLVFHGQDDIMNVCNQIKQQIQPSDEIENILSFLSNSKLGLITKM